MIFLLAIFLLFTGPNGGPIYIVKSQVVAVTSATACPPEAKARIYTSQLPFCVRESVEESVEKVEGQ